ncbi:MAG: ferritin [Alphaproteobacteria bacterium]|nr:ferritin [Alphaproteobacteria bacterium]MBV9694877.1 ferritin [Alphaproteobacteria bacterium]
MSSEVLHVPRERLSRKTLHLHYAITSLMEELEAVDWYRQRADDTDDPDLKAILNHNANEEIEHAAMVLEWIRRHEPRFDKELKEYLFTTAPITKIEQEEEHKDKGA